MLSYDWWLCMVILEKSLVQTQGSVQPTNVLVERGTFSPKIFEGPNEEVD
jgi:hypothetical protein